MHEKYRLVCSRFIICKQTFQRFGCRTRRFPFEERRNGIGFVEPDCRNSALCGATLHAVKITVLSCMQAVMLVTLKNIIKSG